MPDPVPLIRVRLFARRILRLAAQTRRSVRLYVPPLNSTIPERGEQARRNDGRRRSVLVSMASATQLEGAAPAGQGLLGRASPLRVFAQVSAREAWLAAAMAMLALVTGAYYAMQ